MKVFLVIFMKKKNSSTKKNLKKKIKIKAELKLNEPTI